MTKLGSESAKGLMNPRDVVEPQFHNFYGNARNKVIHVPLQLFYFERFVTSCKAYFSNSGNTGVEGTPRDHKVMGLKSAWYGPFLSYLSFFVFH